MLSLPGYGHFVNIITIKVKMVTICDEHKRRLMDQIGIAKTPHQKALRLGFLYPNFEVYQVLVKNVAPEGRALEPPSSHYCNEALGAKTILKMSPQKQI